MKKYTWLLLVFFFINISAGIAREKVEKWDVFELTLEGPSAGNPFIGTVLSARFTNGEKVYEPEGYYDGNGIYKIRFMPDAEGEWTYVTSSNKSTLHGKKGNFTCTPPSEGNHGPVRIRNTYHFQYEDGTPYYPFGTTIYEWPYQEEEKINKTVETLKNSPFNKARFLAIPPHKDKYEEGPLKLEKFPFEGTSRDTWDFSRFNPEFFKDLDARVLQLREIGVEADLILFRPYDKGRWGFDMMDQATNIRFVKYMVARYAAYRNIWWSLANENSFIKSMSDEDWDELFKNVRDKDPYQHLRSIHNAGRIYNYSHSWVTHVSLQYYNAVRLPAVTPLLRDIYRKPIVHDEINYEGDIDRRWGKITGEELTHRFWNALIGGGYATHGESYKTNGWISDGGILTGKSHSRIAFLRKIVEESPRGILEPIDQYYELNMAGKAGEYYLIYFGHDKMKSWDLILPKKELADGAKFKVELIDTWNMTITPLDKIYEVEPMKGDGYKFIDKNKSKIKLPNRPYMALRLTKVGEGGKVISDGRHELE